MASRSTRDEEVNLLLDASMAISSALNVDKITQILCEKISSSRNVSYCRVAILGSCGSTLEIKAARSTREQGECRCGTGEPIHLLRAPHHAQVLKTREPLVLRKNGHLSEESSKGEWEWALTPDTESVLLLPLVSKDETMGVVTLGEMRSWERAPFSAKKISFYQALVNQAAVAIHNAMLYEKTERQVRELSAMHDMSLQFTSTLNYQEVLNVVAHRVVSLIGAQFASVLLPDEENRHLRIVASHNLTPDYINSINNERRIPVGGGPIGRVFTSGKPYTVDNVFSDPDYLPWMPIAEIQEYSSLIALPLLAKGQSIGVICIYFADSCLLKPDEIDLLGTAANEAAIAIENARIYENLQEAFLGIIRSLTESMDAKDSYTRGHLERVSLYAEAIARHLGIDGDELQAIRYAAYLHDVGKIGIPDSILTKNGKLTAPEYQLISKHSLMGERILKPVNFPFPVHAIVRHHHERYDGRGYPDNLARQEIPLGARILFVADAFEAMTSDRPYRKALSIARALEELVDNKHTQFDPRVVDVFVEIITAESFPQLKLSA